MPNNAICSRAFNILRSPSSLFLDYQSGSESEDEYSLAERGEYKNGSQKAVKDKKVTFGKVEVNYHPMILGSHSLCEDTPLTIDWQKERTDTYSLHAFEMRKYVFGHMGVPRGISQPERVAIAARAAREDAAAAAAASYSRSLTSHLKV